MTNFYKIQTLNESQHQLLLSINKEYTEGFLALNTLGPYTVTFYGGARVKADSQTYKDIFELAKELAKRGWGVVSGGGPGVMSACLQGAKAAGGKGAAFRISIGDELSDFEPDISVMFDHFSVRKYMLRQSDLFIYAPGGLGTLDELMENLTLMKTGKYPIKKTILYDTQFWHQYINWFKKLIEEGLVSKEVLDYIELADTPKEVIKILQTKKVNTLTA